MEETMRNRRLATVLGTSGIVGLLATLLAGEARAVTVGRGMFNGNLCQSSSPAIEHGYYGVQNNSTTAVTVFCPVTLPIFGNGVIMTSLELGVYDRNSSANISCTLSGTYPNDGAGDNHATAVSSGGGPGTPFTAVSQSIPRIKPSDTLFLQCTIPPAQQGWVSHIQQYAVYYELP
jgi:hypothetical protein